MPTSGPTWSRSSPSSPGRAGSGSPTAGLPGKWSAADFRYQAQHIVTSKLNNAGHNCIATQVLLLPSQWDGSDRLLDQIRHLLGSLPPRPDYYPGADQRLADILRAHPDAESYAGRGYGLLVPDLTDDQDPLLRQEAFASALGVVRLPEPTHGHS